MGQFQRDIERINQMVDELESDLDRTTRRIELCIEQLDELAERIAKASKTLREQVQLQRANVLAGSGTPNHSLQ